MHYHSTCYGCLPADTILMYQDSRGESQAPGGTAFTSEADAIADANKENTASYMRGWNGHKQVVAPCMGMHCQPYERSHR